VSRCVHRAIAFMCLRDDACRVPCRGAAGGDRGCSCEKRIDMLNAAALSTLSHIALSAKDYHRSSHLREAAEHAKQLERRGKNDGSDDDDGCVSTWIVGRPCLRNRRRCDAAAAFESNVIASSSCGMLLWRGVGSAATKKKGRRLKASKSLPQLPSADRPRDKSHVGAPRPAHSTIVVLPCCRVHHSALL
jgi:hypothetical protein